MEYIILGNDSMNQVQAFGTATGKPFQSEQAADRWRARLDRNLSGSGVDFLVLPITPMPEEMK